MAIYSKTENPAQRRKQPETYYISNLWKWKFKCLNHGFIAQLYYINSIPSDNHSNITKSLKHLLWVHSVSHMVDIRLVKCARVILHQNGFYLKIPLSCGYKDTIKININGGLYLLLKHGIKPAFHKTPRTLHSNMSGRQKSSNRLSLSV